MLEKLLTLQKRIHECYLDDCSDASWMDWYSTAKTAPRLYFMQRGDWIDITFYTNCADEDFNMRKSEDLFEEKDLSYPFVAFCELLSQQEIADKIISLRFEAADEGANGTKEWNFKRLVDSGVIFPNLRSFSVGLTNPTDHNTAIMVSGDRSEPFDEGGIIARLVSVMPELRSLTVPSAPNKSFFELGPLKLTELIIQAGYDRQNFIENLADCDSNHFPDLLLIDYSDYRYVFDHVAGTETPFESYKKLFLSPLFRQERLSFWLRDSILTGPQLSALVTISKQSRGLNGEAVPFEHITSRCKYVEEGQFKY